MAKTNLYNMQGEIVGDIELEDAIFGIEPNEDVVHRIVKNQLANRRQGTSKVKTVVKFVVAEENLIAKKELAEPVKVQFEPGIMLVAELFLDLLHEIFHIKQIRKCAG